MSAKTMRACRDFSPGRLASNRLNFAVANLSVNSRSDNCFETSASGRARFAASVCSNSETVIRFAAYAGTRNPAEASKMIRPRIPPSRESQLLPCVSETV
jgi:hypothetical protein